MSVQTDERPTTAARPPAGVPVVRVLWLAFAGVLVVGALTMGTYQIVTLLAHEERTETTAYPAAGITRLDVESSAGSVRVTASDGDEIVVRAEISDGLRDSGQAQAVVGDVLQLRGSCPNFGSDWCRVSYTVSVPPGVDVRIDADDGSIDVVGTTGLVDVDTDDGSIELRDLAGDVEASNDDGRIEADGLRSANVTADTADGRVRLAFASAPTSVVATSGDGSVEVVVPDDGEAYRLDAESGGSLDADVPTDPDSARSIVVRTGDGSVTARTATSG